MNQYISFRFSNWEENAVVLFALKMSKIVLDDFDAGVHI